LRTLVTPTRVKNRRAKQSKCIKENIDVIEMRDIAKKAIYAKSIN
jgi:hypothetical protein